MARYRAFSETAAPAIGVDVALSMTVPLKENAVGVVGVGDGDVAVPVLPPPHAMAATRNTSAHHRFNMVAVPLDSDCAFLSPSQRETDRDASRTALYVAMKSFGSRRIERAVRASVPM